MKNSVLFSFLFFLVALNAQDISLKVNYIQSIANSDEIGFVLTYNQEISEFNSIGKLKNSDFNIEKKHINKRDFIKNIKESVILYEENILGKNFLVIDSLFFNWRILPSDDTEILGYPCKKAETIFRGREYVAYFTDKIPITDGPWKFFGLPGLILKVISKDSEIKFEAHSISSFNNATDYSNKYKNILLKNPIEWHDYVKLYIKKMQDFIDSERASNETNHNKSFIKITRPEIIFEKIQLGEGAEI